MASKIDAFHALDIAKEAISAAMDFAVVSPMDIDCASLSPNFVILLARLPSFLRRCIRLAARSGLLYAFAAEAAARTLIGSTHPLVSLALCRTGHRSLPFYLWSGGDSGDDFQ